MEATRLAPAGRASSKFNWQNSRFQRTGRFEYCRIRAAPPFSQSPSFCGLPTTPHTDHESRPAGAGHVVAAIGRQSLGRNAAGRQGSEIVAGGLGRIGRRRSEAFAGPEFVSEFETKQDQ